MASTATVYNAMEAAKTAATTYTPSDALKGEGKVYNGVTTVTGGLEAAGSAIETNKSGIKDNADKLAGLTKYDGTTAAATVQAALTDYKTELLADSAAKVAALKNTEVKANADAITKLNGDVDTTGSVLKMIKDNAAGATYSGTTTIADKLAGLRSASERDVAADFTPVPTDYHDTDIATWVAANGTNIADVTTTFKVLSKKLSTVQHDLMDNGDNASSIARALGGTEATDTLPGMVQKLAVNAPYSATETYTAGTLGAAMKANDAKLAGLSKTTVQASIDDAIATAGTAADGKYVAKTDLTPANGQVVLGKDSTVFTEKGTSFTVDTATSKVSAKVFKPSAGSGDVTKTTSFELSNDGFKITSQEGDSAAAAKTVTIADGAVKAESFQLGDKEVTSIDAGAALSYAADATDADKKVMATDAAVINTVKALADTEVKANTDAITKLNGGKTVENSVDYKVYNNAKDAVYETGESGTTTIAQAIANAQGAADTLRTDLATANKGNLVHGSNIIDGTITHDKIGANEVFWGNLSLGIQNKITDSENKLNILNRDETQEGSVKNSIKTLAADATYDATYSIAGKIANNEGRIAANEAKFVGMTDDTVQASIDTATTGLNSRISKVLDSNDHLNNVIVNAAGDEAMIWNEASGGGAMFTHHDGTKSFVGVSGNGKDKIAAQIYAKDSTSNVGSRIDVTTKGVYYTVGNAATADRLVAENELATIGTAKNGIYKAATADTEAVTIENAISANEAKLAGLVVDQGDAETVQNAIDFASSGAAEDLANVLNGTTPFSKVNIGDAWSLVKNSGNNLSIRSSNGENSAIFANNSMTLLDSSEGAGKEYFSVSNNGGLNLKKGGETDPYFNIQNNGNVETKGTLTLKDASDQAAQTLNAAKIKQITTNQTNIGDMSQLHGNDNAMVNRGEGDVAGDPAANIVEALNNISASVGNVHGLATAAANGSLDTKYATQQKPENWYKNGAGNLFPGSATDDHLAELAASIGERNYANTEVYATAVPYLTANESVATSLVALARNLKTVADDYVTKEYFNGGTATTPATISMGANASDIVIGHVAEGAGAGTNIDVNHAEGKVTNNEKTVSVADGTITFNNGKVLKDFDEAIWTNGDFLVNGDIATGGSIYSGANLGVTGEAFIGGNLGVSGNTSITKDLGLGGKFTFGNNTFESVAKEITANSTDAELPTAKAVYDAVKAETTVEAAPNGNYAAGSVKDAVASIDENMGNLALYNETKYANTGTTKVSLAQAIKNLDANVYAKVGAVDFDDNMNYVSSADTDLTKAIKSMDTNVKQAIDDLDGTYVSKAYFSGGEAATEAHPGLIWMGDAASDIRIGTKKSVSGTDSLNSGVEVLADATNGDSVTIKASGATASTGIQVTENGKTVTFKGTNKDVTIVDGEVTAEKATVKTLAFTDGAATPTITTATSVDNTGKDVLAAGVTADGEELASTLTVKNTVEGAVKVDAAANGNYAAGTVKTAVADIDAAIGKRSAYRSSHYANPTADDKDLSTAIKNLDDALFNVTEDYVTKTYFNGGDDTNHYISMGSLAKKVTIGADDSARIVLDVTDDAKKSITMTAGTDMQVAVNGTEITIGDKDGQGIKVDNGGLTTTFVGSGSTPETVVVSEGVVTASDSVVVGDKTTGTAYAEIEDDVATFKGANGTVTIADGTVTANKFAFSDTAYATGIDNTGGVFTAAPADKYTIATTKTVYDNTYLTAAGTNGNYAAGSLLNAVKSIDTYMGNLNWYNNTHYANTGSTKTSLAAAIKNLDTNVFAKVGDVDLSGATNYANTTATPATNLTQAVVNIDSNVKKAIDDLDGKFVTKAYFSGGEQDTTSPNAGRIIMGDTADKITIGRTATSADVTNLTNGIEIDANSGNVVMGKQSITNNVASLEAGVKVSADTGTVEIVSVDTTQNSSNGISVDKDIVKIGTTSNGKFDGISIQDGVMTNINSADANKKSVISSEVVAVTDGTNTSSMAASGVAVTNGTDTTLIGAGAISASDGTKTASLDKTGVNVTNGTSTAIVAADAMSVKSGSNSSSMDATGVAVTDGNKTTLVAAGAISLTDTDNTTGLSSTGLSVIDENNNQTLVGATGMSVTNGTDTTTIAAGSVTTNKVDTKELKLGDYSATSIDQGSVLAPTKPDDLTDVDKATLATNATVKASINGIVADIEGQIHGDSTTHKDIKLGDLAETTTIGKTSDSLSDPLNTNIVVDAVKNKITMDASDINARTSTNLELDNKNNTIKIASSNSDAKTSTGLNITNDETNGKHTIGLSYDKDIPNTVTAHDGLTIDADTHQIALTSTNKDAAGTKKSGLELDNNTNVFKLGASNTPTGGETTSYGMTMDANAGVTKFEDQDGKGVTMNKGDMNVTDSATIGAVDAQGALTGNGVEMKNDGSAKFKATEGAVEIAKGEVTADNKVTVGGQEGNDNSVVLDKDGNVVASNSSTIGKTNAQGALDGNGVQMKNDGSATFQSANGKVGVADGSIEADHKVTADEIEAKTRFYVGDPAGEIAALYKTGLVAVKDADNQATYGSGGMWAKAGDNAATLGGTGLSVSQLDPSDPTSVIASAGVSKTGLWTQSDSKKSSYGNDGLWIGNKAETAFASLNERALFITDGTDTSNIGLDGIYTSQNISAAGNSYVGGNSQVDGVATFGKDAGKQVVIDSGDVTADGKVKGKDLEATNSFTLAGTTVLAIDDSNAKINDFSGAGHDVDTLATTSSIYYNAEDALYTRQQGTYTTVDAKTINEALTAVDNIIGNFPAGLNKDLVDPELISSNLTNGGKLQPETILDAFNNIDSTMGTIHGLAAKLESKGTYMGNLAEGTTVENHLTALDASIGDRRAYTQQNVIKNNESTAKSLDALDMAVGDISKLQGTTYASADNLSDAVVQIDDKLQNLDGRMERAEKDLKDVHHELRRGMASMAAMSALVPNSRSTGKTSLVRHLCLSVQVLTADIMLSQSVVSTT